MFDSSSELGALLKTTDYGRDILAMFDFSRTAPTSIYLDELLSGPVGADVLDYIDRDSHFCGLEHRVDSAIFRRFGFSSVRGDLDYNVSHIIARLHSGIGLRLDAEYSIESVLLQRFSLFMKVYTHPMKTSAGAMLGRAIYHAMADTKKPELPETLIEKCSDVELLLRLKDSRKKSCKDLAEALFQRRLHKVAYRGDAAEGGASLEENYNRRRRDYEQRGLFSAEGREKLEDELAKRASVSRGDVLLYCSPSAPGYQKIKDQYAEREQGKPQKLDLAALSHVRDRHLRLWRLYAFIRPELDMKQRERVAEACEVMFAVKNQIPIARRQGNLFW